MILLLGRDLVRIYNDAYRAALVERQASDLGRPAEAAWAEANGLTASVRDALFRGAGRSLRARRPTVDRRGARQDAWVDLTYMPLRDESGSVVGILGTAVDVTAGVLAGVHQRFRAELEERLRPLRHAVDVTATASEALGGQLDADLVAYADIDAAGETAVIERDWSADGVASIAGVHRLEDFGPTIAGELRAGRTVVVDDVLDDHRTGSVPSRAAFERLKVRALLDIPLLKGGRLMAVLTVLAGRPRAWTAADVELAEATAERTWAAVERARAETALRESEALLDAIFESAPVGLGVWDTELRFVRVNRRLAEMNGISPEAHVGRHPTELLPDLHDLEPLLRSWRRVLETGEPMVGVEVAGATPARPEAVGHWTEHFFPIRVGPTIVGLGGVIEDSSARKRAERQRALLVDELNHRVKNTLAIVQAIARQTFRRSDVPAAAREAFDGRLAALATAHDLLTGSNWESADLRDVAADAVSLCGIADDRTAITGPRVVLEPREAVSMALALHELCTNAMKYGSMSVEGGGVDLHWDLLQEPDAHLRLVWREHGGPPVAQPQRVGFGTRMLAQALAEELAGEVDLDFRPEGLVCTITAPRAAGDGRA